MPLVIDPEGKEIRALEQVGDWRRKQVIEIGCGSGRLTLRLAGLGARVHALDPDARLIRTAREALPRRLARRVSYQVGHAERLDARDATFDRAVFAWSL